ncbi:hypothetical protein Purlil1_13368 [Purpureocillium lilacinum]|uniref:Uncharacterized protein n=1 Tax=Purpureocillium lilacinum TaxID=33203 RepID=A0ABR0BE96_PURLI|nr:hypothetical protein Purlil1_13368 [Purpureocillium lilacinum]
MSQSEIIQAILARRGAPQPQWKHRAQNLPVRISPQGVRKVSGSGMPSRPVNTEMSSSLKSMMAQQTTRQGGTYGSQGPSNMWYIALEDLVALQGSQIKEAQRLVNELFLSKDEEKDKVQEVWNSIKQLVATYPLLDQDTVDPTLTFQPSSE